MRELYYLFSQDYTYITRMHFSRMRTVRCSGHGGRACIPACNGQGVCVSQHALGRVCVCIPACTGQGGVCLGVCLPRECLPRGVSALGGPAQGVLALGGVCSGGVCGGCLPRRGVCHTPHPPVDRMTDACENITLPQLRCRR